MPGRSAARLGSRRRRRLPVHSVDSRAPPGSHPRRLLTNRVEQATLGGALPREPPDVTAGPSEKSRTSFMAPALSEYVLRHQTVWRRRRAPFPAQAVPAAIRRQDPALPDSPPASGSSPEKTASNPSPELSTPKRDIADLQDSVARLKDDLRPQDVQDAMTGQRPEEKQKNSRSSQQRNSSAPDSRESGARASESDNGAVTSEERASRDDRSRARLSIFAGGVTESGAKNPERKSLQLAVLDWTPRDDRREDEGATGVAALPDRTTTRVPLDNVPAMIDGLTTTNELDGREGHG